MSRLTTRPDRIAAADPVHTAVHTAVLDRTTVHTAVARTVTGCVAGCSRRRIVADVDHVGNHPAAEAHIETDRRIAEQEALGRSLDPVGDMTNALEAGIGLAGGIAGRIGPGDCCIDRMDLTWLL